MPDSATPQPLSTWNFLGVLAVCLIGSSTTWADDPVRMLSSQSIQGTTAGERTINSVNIPFCWCPPGKFTMGSPDQESHRHDDEGQVEVTFEHGFWISQHEVTEAEYKLITNRSPRSSLGENYPAADMRSGDARRFAEMLTKREKEAGQIPDDWEYAMPTEAQWEYACRAGTSTSFCFGDSEQMLPEFGNFADKQLLSFDPSEYRYANSRLDDSFPTLAPVESYRANSWGIYDMHGNAWEWCLDEYSPKLPGGKNPQGPERGNGQGRVIRGGSWLSHYHYCRSAMRNAHHDLNSAPYIGIRIVLCPKLRNSERERQ